MIGAYSRSLGISSQGPFSVVDGPVLDEATCDAIVADAEARAGWSSARVSRGSGHLLDLEARSVRSVPLATTAHADALDLIVRQLVRWNDETFRFDLRSIPVDDSVNVLRYDTDTADHFGTHVDAGASAPTRKVTFVLQLTDPDAYRGCDLILTGLGHVATRARGWMTAFPATARHTVTPIIGGRRHCIVGWVHGPTFR